MQAEADDAQNDLAAAEPAITAAMGALDTLNKKDLGLAKTMASPPPGTPATACGADILPREFDYDGTCGLTQ